MRALFRVVGLLGWLSGIAVFFAITVGVLKVVTAHAIGRIVATVVRRDAAGFHQYALIGLVAVGTHGVAAALQSLLSGWFSQLTLARIRRRVALRLTGATSTALAVHHSGDVSSRLSSDLAVLESLARDGLPTLWARLVLAALAAAYMLSHEWRLTLIALAPTPLLVALSNRLSRPLAATGKQAQEALGQASILLKEAVTGADVVRAACMQPVLSTRMISAVDRWADANAAQGARVGLLYAVGMSMAIAPWIAVFSVGGYWVVLGLIDLGTLFTFAEILGAVTFPLTELPSLWGQIRARLAGVERVQALLDIEQERAGGDEASLEASPLFALDHVTFTYPEREQPSLTDVSLVIEQGQTVALVGSSGSGKSTVIRLLLGELSPQTGEVLFSGRPLTSLDLSSLRRHCAVADQDAVLFDQTIGENLRLVRPRATDAELEEAARAAGAASFIRELPEGYSTSVGEGGELLSGGQRQRVSLARALLLDAPILLLDEATSAIEQDLELHVMAGLRARPRPHTRIVATHRLQSIREADVIFVLDAGRVVARGSHEELIDRCDLYANFSRLQEEGLS